MQVLVLGKLGDVCKKLVELDLLAYEQRTNKLLLVDIAAYKEVIAMWPTPNVDKDNVNLRVASLRQAMVTLSRNEKDLNPAHHFSKEQRKQVTENVSCLIVEDYLSSLEQCRKIVGELNALGASSGVIMFEKADKVEEAEVTI